MPMQISISNAIGGGGGAQGGGSAAGPEMIFTITTPSDAFTFDLRSVAGYNNYDIDWGDGSAIETGVTDAIKSHTYATAGLYEIKITGQIYIRNTNAIDSNCYTEFKQWGTATTITGVREFFYFCENMTYTATDAPNFDLSIVASNQYDGPYRLFSTCRAITSLDLSNWDTSQWSSTLTGNAFQNMSRVTSINITGWDVSNIVSAGAWFSGIGNSGSGCTIIAPNLNWASATTHSQCFYNSNIVSLDINNWTLRAAGSNLSQIFRNIGNNVGATGGLDIDISGWVNTSGIAAGTSGSEGLGLFLSSARGVSSINLTGWDIDHVVNFQQFAASAIYLER